MQYWILKTEPDDYSWNDLVTEKQTKWDGVKNYQAQNNISKMRKGDMALIYHTGKERRVVGVATIASAGYVDNSNLESKLMVMDVVPTQSLKQPVSLNTIKEHSSLQNLQILKQPRLSVSQISKDEWDCILTLSNNIQQ